MDDMNRTRFKEAKDMLSMEQIMEIVAERETFLPADIGSRIAPYGAASEEHLAGEDQPSWVVTPEFRDFLKRSL